MHLIERNPLVSVYIPTFNRVEKLKRALYSIFSQTYQNFEILVCDDGSTDSTQQFVMGLIEKDPRVRYLRNSVSEGACSARNLGIFAAKGEFITGLDDDDEFMPARLEMFLNNWSDEYSFICSNFVDRYSNGHEKVYFKKNKQIIKLETLLQSNQASNQIFTKTVRLRGIGGFNPMVKRLQDWDTWIRLCNVYGNFFRISTPLYFLNHDHFEDESRVSKNLPMYLAMAELFERNSALYNESATQLFHSYIKRLKREYLFADMIKDVYVSKSLKPIFHYMKHSYF